MTQQKTYQCAACNGTFEFESGWTDEEAMAERRENFGDMPDSTMVIVCDDCFQDFMLKKEAT